MAEDGSIGAVATLNWDQSAPPLKYQKGITTRWTGRPLHVPIRVSAGTARKAIQEGLPLESDVVELPLTVSFREGKEIMRSSDGNMEGVIETTFGELDWDYTELEGAA